MYFCVLIVIFEREFGCLKMLAGLNVLLLLVVVWNFRERNRRVFESWAEVFDVWKETLDQNLIAD